MAIAIPSGLCHALVVARALPAPHVARCDCGCACMLPQALALHCQVCAAWCVHRISAAVLTPVSCVFVVCQSSGTTQVVSLVSRSPRRSCLPLSTVACSGTPTCPPPIVVGCVSSRVACRQGLRVAWRAVDWRPPRRAGPSSSRRHQLLADGGEHPVHHRCGPAHVQGEGGGAHQGQESAVPEGAAPAHGAPIPCHDG